MVDLPRTDYQVLQSVRTYACRSGIELLATPLGLYDWSCDEDNIRRTQLDVDGTLEEEGSLIVEKSLTSCDLVEEIVELTSAPDGTLFASVQGVTHGVVALDPRTLGERFRFGGGYFRTIAGLCVVDKEVYVCDLVRLHGCSTFGSPCRFGRIQVFSLSGDYLREVRSTACRTLAGSASSTACFTSSTPGPSEGVASLSSPRTASPSRPTTRRGCRPRTCAPLRVGCCSRGRQGRSWAPAISSAWAGCDSSAFYADNGFAALSFEAWV